MIVDFHTYVGESMLGQESTEEDILKNMEENQVDVSVICPVKTIDPFFERQNEYISDLQRKHSGKLKASAGSTRTLARILRRYCGNRWRTWN